jgi:hypothetical protein
MLSTSTPSGVRTNRPRPSRTTRSLEAFANRAPGFVRGSESPSTSRSPSRTAEPFSGPWSNERCETPHHPCGSSMSLRWDGLVVRPGRIRGGPRTDRRPVVPTTPFVTEVDCAVLAVARLHATAERNEILVRIHNRPLGGLRGARVVLAVVESNPVPSELFASANLWPGQSTAHSVFLESHRSGGPNGTPPDRDGPVVCGSPTSRNRIAVPSWRVKQRSVARWIHELMCSANTCGWLRGYGPGTVDQKPGKNDPRRAGFPHATRRKGAAHAHPCYMVAL